MDSIATKVSTSASVFEASTKDPQMAVARAADEVAKHLAKYTASQDVLDRMALLTEVEALRRFVLVRGALLAALRRPGSAEGTTLGRDICDALRGMIGELPDVARSCSLQGARNMERDTRRAIASLAFVGSLDASFA